MAFPGSPFARRRLLNWMVGMAAGAFAVSFVVPSIALRALAVQKPIIAVGDILVYADGATGGEPGRVFTTADLAVGDAAQLFPMGKADNQDNLVQVVRLTAGNGVEGLVAFSAICTHLGCAVYQELTAETLILCPCHGSEYDPAAGAAVRRGPADRALPTLPIAVGMNGTVLVDGPFSGPIGPQ